MKTHAAALALIAVVTLVVAGSVSSRRPDVVLAHGALDQFLIGNPDCNFVNFPGGVSSPQPLLQEFVPSSGMTTASVDLCISQSILSGTITLNIRSGTVAAPGPILATASAPTPITNPAWVHFDLGTGVLGNGGTFLLEVPSTSLGSWDGVCGMIIGVCTSIGPDLYPAGGTNTPTIRDFAFRTFLAPLATATAPPATATATATATRTPTPTGTIPATATATATIPAPAATSQMASAPPPHLGAFIGPVTGSDRNLARAGAQVGDPAQAAQAAAQSAQSAAQSAQSAAQATAIRPPSTGSGGLIQVPEEMDQDP